ncbi:MAG TPA: alpha/beta fold hydrolase [Chitinophagaceae bacterium]|nr:alpha/beta fold hydrolase [Chitinophagaceae bacterium]
MYLKILIAVYLIGGLIIFFIQDLILFHPKPLAATYKFNFNQPYIEHNILADGGRNLSILQFPVSNKKGIVIFFHGNMKNVEHYKKYVPFITSFGFELWMVDYPGFGKSTGKRSEQAMYNDALTTYRLATNKTNDNIFIYGKSIGTGVATQLASIVPCKQLILETPYYSIAALAKHYFPMYPVLPMSRYLFPTFQNIKKVKAPTTILHGTDDEIIPFGQAKKLKEENSMIQLITIENGKHNNLLSFDKFRTTLDSLLRQ